MSFFNANITGGGAGGTAGGLVTKIVKKVTITTGVENASVEVNLTNDISNYASITNEQIIVELVKCGAIASGDSELSHEYEPETGVLTISSSNSSVPLVSNTLIELKFNIYIVGAVQIPSGGNSLYKVDYRLLPPFIPTADNNYVGSGGDGNFSNAIKFTHDCKFSKDGNSFEYYHAGDTLTLWSGGGQGSSNFNCNFPNYSWVYGYFTEQNDFVPYEDDYELDYTKMFPFVPNADTNYVGSGGDGRGSYSMRCVHDCRVFSNNSYSEYHYGDVMTLWSWSGNGSSSFNKTFAANNYQWELGIFNGVGAFTPID